MILSLFFFSWFLDGEEVLRVPDPLIDENPDWTGFWDFGAPWNPGNDNPWVDGTNMAPFDQEVTITNLQYKIFQIT